MPPNNSVLFTGIFRRALQCRWWSALQPFRRSRLQGYKPRLSLALPWLSPAPPVLPSAPLCGTQLKALPGSPLSSPAWTSRPERSKTSLSVFGYQGALSVCFLTICVCPLHQKTTNVVPSRVALKIKHPSGVF